LAGAGADQPGAVAIRAGVLGVGVGDREVRVGVVAVGLVDRLGALGVDADRAAAVHAEAPLGDVVVVGAPVGHLAAGILVPPAELVVAALLDVVDRGGLAEPEVPVEPLGHRGRRERALLGVVAD